MKTLLFAFALAAAGAGAVTSKNWETHPSVVASRDVYKEVTAAVGAKTWRVIDAPDCVEEFTTWFLATDGQGVARYLRYEGGSGDSSQTVEQYYDAKGRVRFVFGRVGAVPSSWVEARWWLDESGAVVWTRRASGGEGPTYYLNELDPILVKKPLAGFAKNTRCP